MNHIRLSRSTGDLSKRLSITVMMISCFGGSASARDLVYYPISEWDDSWVSDRIETVSKFVVPLTPGSSDAQRLTPIVAVAECVAASVPRQKDVGISDEDFQHMRSLAVGFYIEGCIGKTFHRGQYAR